MIDAAKTAIEHESLAPSVIVLDPDLQSRDCLDERVVAEYTQLYLDGADMPPVVVYYDGSAYWLADGWHRVSAALAAGVDEIDAEIREGTRRDALLHSLGANAAHGLRRSNADKERAVSIALHDDELRNLSDREIARLCGVTHPFVAKHRRRIYEEVVTVTTPEPSNAATSPISVSVAAPSDLASRLPRVASILDQGLGGNTSLSKLRHAFESALGENLTEAEWQRLVALGTQRELWTHEGYVDHGRLDGPITSRNYARRPVVMAPPKPTDVLAAPGRTNVSHELGNEWEADGSDEDRETARALPTDPVAASAAAVAACGHPVSPGGDLAHPPAAWPAESEGAGATLAGQDMRAEREVGVTAPSAALSGERHISGTASSRASADESAPLLQGVAATDSDPASEPDRSPLKIEKPAKPRPSAMPPDEMPTPEPISERADYDGDSWGTPAAIIEDARAVLGGIDLDPASNEQAQQTVRANVHHTKADDGLARTWHGRVWLNPPFSHPLCAQFTAKLVAEYDAARVEAALLLVNNVTDTAWFQTLLARFPVCLTKGRIAFMLGGRAVAQTRQGQAIFYLGPDVARFCEVFGKRGVIVTAVSP